MACLLTCISIYVNGCPRGVVLGVLDPVPLEDVTGVVDVEDDKVLVDVGARSPFGNGRKGTRHVPPLELDVHAVVVALEVRLAARIE